MEAQLRIYKDDPVDRWKCVQSLQHDLVFLSFRDDARFVSLHTMPAPPPSIEPEAVLNLRSAVTTADELRSMMESPVLELRQYRVFPGKRDAFAKFFRENCLQPLVEYGMKVYGQFDDVDDENVFTWFRGFPDLVERDRRKAAFYGSQLWLNELQDEAFSMIEDYTNVMLVMPVTR